MILILFSILCGVVGGLFAVWVDSITERDSGGRGETRSRSVVFKS